MKDVIECTCFRLKLNIKKEEELSMEYIWGLKKKVHGTIQDNSEQYLDLFAGSLRTLKISNFKRISLLRTCWQILEPPVGLGSQKSLKTRGRYEFLIFLPHL